MFFIFYIFPLYLLLLSSFSQKPSNMLIDSNKTEKIEKKTEYHAQGQLTTSVISIC